MNIKRQLVRGALLLCVPTLVAGEPPAQRVAPPVAATVETSLPTAGCFIRGFAFDGDDRTFFASDRKPGAHDHFTLVLDRPVAAKSIAVMTGVSDGWQKLDGGMIEVSEDGKTYRELAILRDGAARVNLNGRRILAIRIKPASNSRHELVIREIVIESSPAVATFQYPIEIQVDVNDAPEMKAWAEKVARACERLYPSIIGVLKSKGSDPPHRVTMTLKKSYQGVAETLDGHITASVTYFKNHPRDGGAFIHEMAHVVQAYPSNGPSWLVEGIADYVRFFKFERGKLGAIDPDRAHYHGSYRISAAFLAYASEKYDKDLVPKLNRLMQRQKYTEGVFMELTGKSLDELDEEWRATLRH
jgi:hypothetical protein